MAPPTFTLSAGSDQLLLPSQDPWYTAPPGLEASAPGTVLRIRTVPRGSVIFTNASAVYHILYRTTDSHYKPTWAVTHVPKSLLIPKKAFVSSFGYNALLSYQMAYNSPSIDWGPSYRIYQPAQANPFGIPSDHEVFNSMIGRGWFVTIPDFEGPRAAFSATVLAGHATLDAIRAVLSLAGTTDISLPSDANKFNYAMWGYSGGSIASEKAAELQVQYAPELSTGFMGAALGGLVSNLGSVYSVINKSPFTGNLVIALLGIMNEYPEADAYLRSRLKTEGPQNAAAFLAGRGMNSLQAFPAYGGQDIYGYFIGGKADLEDSTILRRIGKAEWMLGYHGAPEIPLFVYKAVGDEMSPIGDTDEHMAHYRRFNVSLLYERNTVGGHISEIVNGQNRAIEWLTGVFNGSRDTADQGFKSHDVSVDIYKPPKF